MAIPRWTFNSLGGPTHIPDARVAEAQRQQQLGLQASQLRAQNQRAAARAMQAGAQHALDRRRQAFAEGPGFGLKEREFGVREREALARIWGLEKELGLEGELGRGGLSVQREGLGLRRDLGQQGLELQREGLGLRRDLGQQGLDLRRDLGQQGLDLRRDQFDAGAGARGLQEDLLRLRLARGSRDLEALPTPEFIAEGRRLQRERTEQDLARGDLSLEAGGAAFDHDRWEYSQARRAATAADREAQSPSAQRERELEAQLVEEKLLELKGRQPFREAAVGSLFGTRVDPASGIEVAGELEKVIASGKGSRREMTGVLQDLLLGMRTPGEVEALEKRLVPRLEEYVRNSYRWVPDDRWDPDSVIGWRRQSYLKRVRVVTEHVQKMLDDHKARLRKGAP